MMISLLLWTVTLNIFWSFNLLQIIFLVETHIVPLACANLFSWLLGLFDMTVEVFDSFLLFHMTKCFRMILYISYFRTGINHFTKKSSYLKKCIILMGMVFQDPNLGSRMFIASQFVIVFKPLQ